MKTILKFRLESGKQPNTLKLRTALDPFGPEAYHVFEVRIGEKTGNRAEDQSQPTDQVHLLPRSQQFSAGAA